MKEKWFNLFSTSLLVVVLLSAGQALTNQGVVNINTASSSQLQRLKGVGSKTAQSIIEYRQKQPFKSIDELTKVKRIGKKLVAKLRPFICITGKTTLVKAQKKIKKTK
jgi:competence protein ComEA